MKARQRKTSDRSDQSKVRRGDSYKFRVLNAGPHEVNEIVDIFEIIDEEELASCWVSVLADCLSTYDVPLGVLVRTLCVISERLHGVSLTLCKRGKVSGTKKPKRALGDALLQREGLSEYKVRIVRHMDISDKKT